MSGPPLGRSIWGSPDAALREGRNRGASVRAGGISSPTYRWSSWTPRPCRRRPRGRCGRKPFGGGPHICLGSALALLEIGAALAMLCRNFDLEPIMPADEVREHMAFTMLPAGLKARFRRRHAG